MKRERQMPGRSAHSWRKRRSGPERCWFSGRSPDIEIQARELVRARQRIAGVIARETGRSLASVLADIDRDRWMSAEEAIEYGLVSKIITRQIELPG
ncbi:MAG: ATP-dependent Clp protease proteolytic subunit [Betaproteobacteria bacterium]|nr:MAG: ATP-dependent Clp protease proteolytic subunit [Betaproteobacteria bacterium]